MLPLQYNIMMTPEKGINCIFQTTKPQATGFRNIEGKLNYEEKHPFQRCTTAVGGKSSKKAWRPLDKIHSSLWLPSPGLVTVRHLKCLIPFCAAMGSAETLFSRCKINSAHKITSNTDPVKTEDSRTPNWPGSTAAHSTPWHCQGLFPTSVHHGDCVSCLILKPRHLRQFYFLLLRIRVFVLLSKSVLTQWATWSFFIRSGKRDPQFIILHQ